MFTVQSSSREALRSESLPLPLYLGFVLTGIVTVLLGPLLPVLSTQWTRVPEPNSAANFRALTILGILFFLSWGQKVLLGGWVALYSRRVGGAGDSISTLIPSVFWAMLILGRSASSGLLRRTSELRLVCISLPVARVEVIVLIAAQGPGGIVSGIGLAGLGLAAMYPITIVNLSRMGEGAMRVSGPMFALAGLGGATLPGLVGLLSARYGSVRVGLAIPLCSALVMTGLYLSAPRWQVSD
jgi:fucose permease